MSQTHRQKIRNSLDRTKMMYGLNWQTLMQQLTNDKLCVRAQPDFMLKKNPAICKVGLCTALLLSDNAPQQFLFTKTKSGVIRNFCSFIFLSCRNFVENSILISVNKLI